jgi:hypothetical protein
LSFVHSQFRFVLRLPLGNSSRRRVSPRSFAARSTTSSRRAGVTQGGLQEEAPHPRTVWCRVDPSTVTVASTGGNTTM